MALPGNTAFGMLNSGTTLPASPSPYKPPTDNSGQGPGTTPYASTPYNSPIPGVSSYMGADAQALKSYNDALASVNYNRQQLLAQNGYTANIDPTTGSVNDLRVDPNNQYGALQQMLNSQAQQDMAAHDASAGAGLVGGLAHQAEHQLSYQHGAESQNFGQQLFGNLQSLLGQQTSASNTYNNTLWNDQMNAALAAMMNQQFNPADFTQYANPSNFTDAEQAAMGSPGYGASPFSQADTNALAAKFGNMTAQQLKAFGITTDPAGKTVTKTTTKKKAVSS